MLLLLHAETGETEDLAWYGLCGHYFRPTGAPPSVFGEVVAVAPVLRPAPSPLGGYFSDDYADKLRAAYRAEPARFRRMRHGAFRALRDAAGLTEVQERTVKRGLRYEGSAVGFPLFVQYLFAAEGQGVPE